MKIKAARLGWGGAILCLAATHVLASGQDIRGYWRMNHGTGTEIADASGNGNLAVGKSFAWAQGVNSAGVVLKEGGWINCGNDPSLSPSEAISIEAWVRPWKMNFSDHPAIVHKDGEYVLGFIPGNRLGFTLWLDGEQHTLGSMKTEWKDGAWVHVAATYDGEKMTLYVDGEQDHGVAAAGGIDAGRSFLYIGSANREHIFWNPIDEVRVAGRAFSPEEIRATHMAGRYEVDRADARFSAFFHKGEKRTPEAVVPGYLWVDAEDFEDYGGWWMETQFVPQMGSPYLMAAGTGTPVADARTTVRVDDAGTYKLWVRNKNWIRDYDPGTFGVMVGGTTSPVTFGTVDLEAWVWQDGGTFDLEAGEVELALRDLTGHYGRCDALLLTRDLTYTPPASLAGYQGECRRLTGANAGEMTVGDYDVVVVGAGVAGINAAIASSRSGARTALIQNRPMIGGNNSPEMGVPVLGPADYGKKNARESGLNEEAGREQAYHFHLKWSQGAERMAATETNLTIFLNTHVYDVERTDGFRITAVRAFDMIDGHLTRYTGDMFIDCTGDGWVGYYAGAELMRGRESRTMFGESKAPDQADIITMSGSLFHAHTLAYNSVDTGSPSPYEGPDWLWDLRYNTTNLQVRKRYEGTYRSGSWWHENRGTVDDLWDPEAARDGLVRVSLSYWNWMKNYSDHKDQAGNRRLLPVPVTNAKRETRRLVGDHILTQDEVLRAEPFPDRVAYGGWGLDIHHPEGIFSTEGPFDFNTPTPMHNIPFRILYSKNVPNLLFAGRNVSVTHVALGTVRVQGTTGVMGQAVGTAAAMCTRYGTDPRGLYASRMTELQQQLLKDDQYIIGLRNEDPADLARKATVTVSSEMPGQSFSRDDVIARDKAHLLNHERAMMFRLGRTPRLGRVELLLRSDRPEPTKISLRVRAASAMKDFSSETDLTTADALVPPGSESWVAFEVNRDVDAPYAWFVLPVMDRISWVMMEEGPLGSCRAYRTRDGQWVANENEFCAFRLDVPVEYPGAFGPENIVGGISRVVGDEMNMWASDPVQAMPQWVELDFGESTGINAIYLTFDTDVNDAKHCTWEYKDSERMVPECVRDYRVMVETDSGWDTVAEVRNNYQRRRIHRFPALEASRVNVVIEATNGDPSARIYEIRAYRE